MSKKHLKKEMIEKIYFKFDFDSLTGSLEDFNNLIKSKFPKETLSENIILSFEMETDYENTYYGKEYFAIGKMFAEEIKS